MTQKDVRQLLKVTRRGRKANAFISIRKSKECPKLHERINKYALKCLGNNDGADFWRGFYKEFVKEQGLFSLEIARKLFIFCLEYLTSQRIQKLLEIEDKLLLAEIEEERIIQGLERRGIKVDRRPEASPLARLGLIYANTPSINFAREHRLWKELEGK